jgi:Calcineurin-like phosphoesterase
MINRDPGLNTGDEAKGLPPPYPGADGEDMGASEDILQKSEVNSSPGDDVDNERARETTIGTVDEGVRGATTVDVDDLVIWGDGVNRFWDKLELNEPTDEEVKELLEKLDEREGKQDLNLYFDNYRNSEKPNQRFIDFRELSGEIDLWMVGDLHGDILGLETVLNYAEKCSGEATRRRVVTFMGDLFDRGDFGHKVLFKVLRLIADDPASYALIVGNHDEGLMYADGQFSSSVQPAEFSEWLNRKEPNSPWCRLAIWVINFFKKAPRAVLLPDGLLLAHGGVPHVDKHEKIQSADDFDLDDVGMDFVWTRLHPDAKRKIPNRHSRGCSIGIEDFGDFARKVDRVFERKMIGIVRGHDHLESRYAFFEKYEEFEKPFVLTINTICYRQSAEVFGSNSRPAIIAKWNSGSHPSVYSIAIPERTIEKTYFPKDPDKSDSV